MPAAIEPMFSSSFIDFAGLIVQALSAVLKSMPNSIRFLNSVWRFDIEAAIVPSSSTAYFPFGFTKTACPPSSNSPSPRPAPRIESLMAMPLSSPKILKAFLKTVGQM